jgi:hypothetical protein
VKWHERLGLPECPYVHRWRLELRGAGSLRVHHWTGNDDNRAFHDHAWWFWTLVVKGGYTDNHPGGFEILRAPALRYRPAEYQHAVFPHEGGAWTILLTGPKVRNWGFWENLADGRVKFRKARRWFESKGHHPCD